MKKLPLIIEYDEKDKGAAEVLVDGEIEKKPYRFLLDTGAAKTIILLDRFSSKFKSYKSETSSGVYAQVKLDKISVETLKIGPLIKNNLEIYRHNDQNPKYKNLLGIDVIKDYCCYFNFEDNFIDFYWYSVNQSPVFLHDLILGKKFHPYIQIILGKNIINAVWDTGASMTLVDLKLINQYPENFEKIGDSEGTDASGTTLETPIFNMKNIIIANSFFSSHKIAGVDLSFAKSTTEDPMDIILGYSTLCKANWFFDFPKKKWSLIKLL